MHNSSTNKISDAVFEARTDDNKNIILAFKTEKDEYFLEEWKTFGNEKFLETYGSYPLNELIWEIRHLITFSANEDIICKIKKNNISAGKEISVILP